MSSVTDMCVSFVTDFMKLNGTQSETKAHNDSSFSIQHFHSAAGQDLVAAMIPILIPVINTRFSVVYTQLKRCMYTRS